MGYINPSHICYFLPSNLIMNPIQCHAPTFPRFSAGSLRSATAVSTSHSVLRIPLTYRNPKRSTGNEIIVITDGRFSYGSRIHLWWTATHRLILFACSSNDDATRREAELGLDRSLTWVPNGGNDKTLTSFWDKLPWTIPPNPAWHIIIRCCELLKCENGWVSGDRGTYLRRCFKRFVHWSFPRTR